MNKTIIQHKKTEKSICFGRGDCDVLKKSGEEQTGNIYIEKANYKIAMRGIRIELN